MSKTLEEKMIVGIFPTLLDHIRDGVYVVDHNGKMFFINKTVERLEGYTNEEVKGKHINQLYSQDFSPSLEVIRTRKPIKNYENKYYVNGKYFTMDCTTFPIMDGDKLLAVVSIHKDVTSLKNLVMENLSLQNSLNAPNSESKSLSDAFTEIIGESPNFKKAIHIAQIASMNDASVFLAGSTGSGKEVFAKAIHKTSTRKDKPFLAINCTAIPDTLFESILFGTSKGSFTGAENTEGLFEQAHGGTLFLDEINSMSYVMQAKLLRALETKEVRRIGGKDDIPTDVRIISSSSALPQEALSLGQIREDLFYRLAVIDITIPNLASRGDDVFLLADYFIKAFNEKLSKKIISYNNDVRHFFTNYSWPGNVRQLRHCIEYAVTIASHSEQILNMSHLPQYILEDDEVTAGSSIYTIQGDTKRQGNSKMQGSPKIQGNPKIQGGSKVQGNSGTQGNHKVASNSEIENPAAAKNVSAVFKEIEKAEIEKIVNTLFECNGNVSKCARELNIHRQSLIHKMKKYGITRK